MTPDSGQVLKPHGNKQQPAHGRYLPRGVQRDMPTFLTRTLPIAALLLALSIGMDAPFPFLSAARAASASTEEVAPPPPLVLRTPSDFVKITAGDGTLFEENARQLGERGTLLRLFLPENQAHFYEEGKNHALTRQLVVYTMEKKDKAAFETEEVALLGRILEESFRSFGKIPEEAQHDSLALEETLLQAAHKGRNILIDTRTTENLRLFQYQLVYSLSSGQPDDSDDSMCTSLTSAMMLVRGHIVFICASSINTQSPLYEDATWTRDVVDKYMATLMADNKKN